MTSRQRRILVLDSDEQTLIELQKTLEDYGFDTTVTWDTAEALNLLRSRPYDLLVVGDHPPEVTGGEILRELQYCRAAVPCVILQRGSKTFDPDYFYSLGASGVITNWESLDLGRWVLQRLSQQRAAAAS